MPLQLLSDALLALLGGGIFTLEQQLKAAQPRVVVVYLQRESRERVCVFIGGVSKGNAFSPGGQRLFFLAERARPEPRHGR